jgi:hypothetical protein
MPDNLPLVRMIQHTPHTVPRIHYATLAVVAPVAVPTSPSVVRMTQHTKKALVPYTQPLPDPLIHLLVVRASHHSPSPPPHRGGQHPASPPLVYTLCLIHTPCLIHSYTFWSSAHRITVRSLPGIEEVNTLRRCGVEVPRSRPVQTSRSGSDVTVRPCACARARARVCVCVCVRACGTAALPRRVDQPQRLRRYCASVCAFIRVCPLYRSEGVPVDTEPTKCQTSDALNTDVPPSARTCVCVCVCVCVYVQLTFQGGSPAFAMADQNSTAGVLEWRITHVRHHAHITHTSHTHTHLVFIHMYMTYMCVMWCMYVYVMWM